MKFKLLIIKIFLYTTFLGFAKVSLATAAPDVWQVLRSEFRMTHEVTRAEVQEQIRWLVQHPSYLHKVCRQSEPYIYHILAEIKKRKLPGELALIPMIESAYDPFAYSGAGAAGLWQLMPKTGHDLGLKQDWWFDGRRSIGPSTKAALNYLIYLNKFFEGNWILAIAAYDSGEGTVAKAMQLVPKRQKISFWNLPLSEETKVYVPRFLALAEIFNNPGRYRVNLPQIPYLPYFEEVEIGSQIDLSHAAKLAGISYKKLIKLNPGYNHWTTAPYKPFKLLIPKEKVQQFNLNLSNLPEEDRVSWAKHLVQSGDSLSSIAIRYHTTVNLIKELNQLTSNHVKPHQAILIPSNKHSPQVARLEKQKLKVLKKPANQRLIHIVQANDNYQKLEKIYGVSAREIRRWNQLAVNQKLHQGQQLLIWKRTQAAQHYVVRKGDSLSQIAKKQGISLRQLLRLNPKLGRNDALRIGQKINC